MRDWTRPTYITLPTQEQLLKAQEEQQQASEASSDLDARSIHQHIERARELALESLSEVSDG